MPKVNTQWGEPCHIDKIALHIISHLTLCLILPFFFFLLKLDIARVQNLNLRRMRNPFSLNSNENTTFFYPALEVPDHHEVFSFGPPVV